MEQIITRKFLVLRQDWASLADGIVIRQGYLVMRENLLVRVRVAADEGLLTVRGLDEGNGRFDYGIPPSDARQILIEICEKPILEKTRYNVDFDGWTWTVDVFHSDNEGLALARVKSGSDEPPDSFPRWIGREVTGEGRYSHDSLVKNPFRMWKDTG